MQEPVSEFWQERSLFGWQDPMLRTQAKAFSPLLQLCRGSEVRLATPILFQKVHCVQQGFQATPMAVAWMWDASYQECFSTAWLGELSAQHSSWEVALRAGCGTMWMLHTMLWDHLSNWFLQVGLILPETERKQTGYFQQDWGQRWPQRRNSWEISSPQWFCVDHRNDRPFSVSLSLSRALLHPA